MATQPPVTFTPPSPTVLSELWYAKTETGTGLTQVFGVQNMPAATTPKEFITYRTLESPTEFAVKGVRPFESIEIDTIFYKEQFEELRLLADTDEELWWFKKLPDSQNLVEVWRGSLDVSLAEIALDDMIRATITIGKSTDPKFITALPTI